MSLEILGFKSNDSLASRVWQFDCDLYRNDPHWNAPSRTSFLRHLSTNSDLCSEASGQRHFVAQLDGQVVGHVSAFRNRELLVQGHPIGTLGLFECVESDGVAGELLRVAVEWLQKKHDIAQIYAPVNCDIWRGYRLMTRGFELDSFVGEPRNQRYYPEFFAQHGFAVRKRWYSLELKDHQSIAELQTASADQYRQVVAEGYRFQAIDPNDEQQIKILCDLVSASYERFTLYTRPPAGVLDQLAVTVSGEAAVRLSLFAVDPNDVPCGFAIAFADPSGAMRRTQTPTGSRPETYEWRPDRLQSGRVVFYLIGITPDEFHRRHGVGRALFFATLDGILRSGCEKLVLALIADDSPAQSLMGRFMDSPSREYALYEMVL